MVILEEVNIEYLQEFEKKWIKYYREVGGNLTNITEGGQGGATNKGRKFKRTRMNYIRTQLSHDEKTVLVLLADREGNTPNEMIRQLIKTEATRLGLWPLDKAGRPAKEQTSNE
jgi:hypothetical protein